MRHAFAAKTRQALRAAIAGQKAKFHFGLAEPRIFAGDANGAAKRQFAAAAEREAINRRNRGLAHGLELVKGRLAEQRIFFALDRGLLRQFVDVRAGDEGFFARASDDQRANAGIGARCIEGASSSSTVARFRAFKTCGRLTVIRAI